MQLGHPVYAYNTPSRDTVCFIQSLSVTIFAMLFFLTPISFPFSFKTIFLNCSYKISLFVIEVSRRLLKAFPLYSPPSLKFPINERIRCLGFSLFALPNENLHVILWGRTRTRETIGYMLSVFLLMSSVSAKRP